MSEFSENEKNGESEEYNHKGPSVIEVLVFLICSMIVIGFIGAVVWMFMGMP